MRQVTNRIVDLFKGLKTSATLGQQDSLIELRNQVSSVLELPGPLKNANHAAIAPGTVIGDSTYVQLTQAFAGVHALTQIFSEQILDAGLWHIQGFGYFGWTVGVVTLAQQQDVGIQDPEGFTITLGQADRATLNGNVAFRIDTIVSLDRPGWRFLNQIDGTLAADTVVARLSVVANKLL